MTALGRARRVHFAYSTCYLRQKSYIDSTCCDTVILLWRKHGETTTLIIPRKIIMTVIMKKKAFRSRLLYHLVKERDRLNIDILRYTEVRWTGISILVIKTSGSVVGFIPFSERMVTLQRTQRLKWIFRKFMHSLPKLKIMISTNLLANWTVTEICEKGLS